MKYIKITTRSIISLAETAVSDIDSINSEDQAHAKRLKSVSDEAKAIDQPEAPFSLTYSLSNVGPFTAISKE